MTRATKRVAEREMTFEEYLLTPEMKQRHEVVDGVLVMSPPPNVSHQLILGNLFVAILSHCRLHDLGTVLMAPCDLLIRKRPKLRVRQPDLSFISRGRAGREDMRNLQVIELTPDLAIEILSPSNLRASWADRVSDYASIGLPELWLVDPADESVEIMTLAEGAYVRRHRFEKDDEVQSPTLPGLRLPVRSIFA
jgi:Uma2 family endonuclease